MELDVNFCGNWRGSGFPPENKFCRVCPSELCDRLWRIVKRLASENNFEGMIFETMTGKRFRLFTTSGQSEHICKFQSLSPDRKGVAWNIPKEDFLYVLKTGRNDTPSRTRQKSHVEPVIEYIRQLEGGKELIDAIRKL